MTHGYEYSPGFVSRISGVSHVAPSSSERAMLSGVRNSGESLKTTTKWPSFNLHIEIPESGLGSFVGFPGDQVFPLSVDAISTMFGAIRNRDRIEPSLRCANAG